MWREKLCSHKHVAPDNLSNCVVSLVTRGNLLLSRPDYSEFSHTERKKRLI